MPMTLNIQIAKFKFRQYQLRIILQNLMLAKITHYTVYMYHPPIFPHRPPRILGITVNFTPILQYSPLSPSFSKKITSPFSMKHLEWLGQEKVNVLIR